MSFETLTESQDHRQQCCLQNLIDLELSRKVLKSNSNGFASLCTGTICYCTHIFTGSLAGSEDLYAVSFCTLRTMCFRGYSFLFLSGILFFRQLFLFYSLLSLRINRLTLPDQLTPGLELTKIFRPQNLNTEWVHLNVKK